jgi:hypothetical protein
MSWKHQKAAATGKKNPRGYWRMDESSSNTKG